MKRSNLMVCTCVLLLATCLTALGVDDAAKRDLALMQGEWTMVSGERGGMQMPANIVATGRRVCKDDQVTVNVGGMLIMKATFTVDASKSPRTIDYDVKDGPSKGKKQLGIYELNGDTLKFCFAEPDQPRPDSFETKAGDGRTLSVWKKAAKQD